MFAAINSNVDDTCNVIHCIIKTDSLKQRLIYRARLLGLTSEHSGKLEKKNNLGAEVSIITPTDLQDESLSRKQLPANFKWVFATSLNDQTYKSILYKSASNPQLMKYFDFSFGCFRAAENIKYLNSINSSKYRKNFVLAVVVNQ